VSISGAWSGHLLLGFEVSAANEVARAMFGLGSQEASQDEMTDAVGELANIIAGNVKSMLPEPSTLSLPQVVTRRSGHRTAGRLYIRPSALNSHGASTR